MMAAVARKGIIVAYGMLSPEPTILPLFEGFLKYATIKTFDVHEVYDDPTLLSGALGYIRSRVETKHFEPRLSQTFDLERIADAHRHMEASDHIGKIIVVP